MVSNDVESVNPNGIPSFSPALRGTSYAGKHRPSPFNPEWVASDGIARDWRAQNGFNPFRVDEKWVDDFPG